MQIIINIAVSTILSKSRDDRKTRQTTFVAYLCITIYRRDQRVSRSDVYYNIIM